MDADTYYDKVYGCWLGKSIGGTIGGPLEGRKEFLDVPLEFPSSSIANDDLDLQLVWLNLLREEGLHISPEDLARAWLEHVTYPFDEYGVAIANLKMGLGPPLTGAYNNFFRDCMGAPIRSELWAALFPGRPAVAGHYAYLDAQVDHWDEGVYGEVFFACLESLAFVGSDVEGLIAGALEFLPTTSEVRGAVELVVELVKRGRGLREARDAVLERYGRPNFTHCVQNIAFTVLGLLHGEGDFLRTIVRAAQCGYDVDCTAATAGAIAGILLGREKILREALVKVDDTIVAGWGIEGCDPPRSVGELSEETVKLGRAALAEPDLPAIGKPFELPALPAFEPPCRFPVLVSPSVPLGRADEMAARYALGMDEQCKEVLFDTYYFDLAPHLTGKPPEVVFLSTHFKPKQPGTLKLFPASTDGVKLWLDGELVLSYSDRKPFLPAPHRPGSPLAVVEVGAGPYRSRLAPGAVRGQAPLGQPLRTPETRMGWHRVLLQVVARSASPDFAWIVADESNHHVVDLEYAARRR